jgi:hypothetical protein
VAIESFVSAVQVEDTRRYRTAYYLAPQHASAHAYRLLRDVIRSRDHRWLDAEGTMLAARGSSNGIYRMRTSPPP